MELDELIEMLSVGGQRKVVTTLASRLDPEAPGDWRRLAAVLAAAERAPVIGISGGQGAGKSTLARLLVAAIELTGRSAVACSLDDFYLPRGAREKLGKNIHPLLATRGVPGTHDVQLALDTLAGLTRNETTRVPVFDKGRDDLLPPSAWRSVPGPVSQVVFEGWCLGASPQPSARLEIALNHLETFEDEDGEWRHYVDLALSEDYQELWDRIDFLVYLQVPDFVSVARWRSEQEQQLSVDRRMSAASFKRFLSHYERLTLWMLETLPAQANLVVELDADHAVARVRLK